MLKTFNDDPYMLMTNHGRIAMTLKPKPSHPNGSVQKKDRKKYIKFIQMWRFCSLCSSIAMAWCIMNSCHKVLRSIRKYFLEVIRRLHKAIRQKLTALWKNQTWILHHDNGTSWHINACAWIFGQKHPALNPGGFFLFPELKTPMKRKRFDTIEELKGKSKLKLLAIPKSAIQNCFADWKKRWQKCIIAERGYFEENKIVIDK